MVEVLATQEKARVENGMLITEFRIPAFSKSSARRRAKANARAKGISVSEVNEPEQVGTGQIPGQKIFSVEVLSER